MPTSITLTALRRHAPTVPTALAVLLATGCLSDSQDFSPEADDQAMATIEQRWEVGGAEGMKVNLCEDLSFVPDTTDTCVEVHSVQGDGRGRRHSVDTGGVGCGGCPMGNIAHVTGTITGLGLGADTAVTGEFGLGTSNSADAYAFPYGVYLTCVDPMAPCSLSGTLDEDGTLTLHRDDDAAALAGTPIVRTAQPVDAATCAAPPAF